MGNNNDAILIKKIKSGNLEDLAIFNEKSQPTDIESPCVANNARLSACEQLCFSMPSSVRQTSACACTIGELASDGRTCKAPKEYLIFAMENEIRGLTLSTNSDIIPSSSMPWKPVTGLGTAIGIDYDYRDNKIIFTDISTKKISSFSIKNENQVIEDIIKQNMSLSRQLVMKPEGVAYDWVMDTIYYADEDLNQIISYKISNKMRYVIGQSQSPRAIVVHPCKGYVFWSDVGRNPMIARSSLAGSNFKRIITTDIKWPNGLTIDFDEEKLYWADAFYDKIERCDFDGNFRQILSTGWILFYF